MHRYDATQGDMPNDKIIIQSCTRDTETMNVYCDWCVCVRACLCACVRVGVVSNAQSLVVIVF